MKLPEFRGEWPGGLRHNERGFAEFELDPATGEDRPVWDCRLCCFRLLHSQAEHNLVTVKAAPA